MKITVNVDSRFKSVLLAKFKKEFEGIQIKKGLEIVVSVVKNVYFIKLLNKGKILIELEDSIAGKLFRNLSFNIVKLKNFIDDSYLLEHFQHKSSPSDKPPYVYFSYDKARVSAPLFKKYEKIMDELDFMDINSPSGEDVPYDLEFFGTKCRMIYYSKNKFKTEFIYFNIDDKVEDICNKLIIAKRIKI